MKAVRPYGSWGWGTDGGEACLPRLKESCGPAVLRVRVDTADEDGGMHAGVIFRGGDAQDSTA